MKSLLYVSVKTRLYGLLGMLGGLMLLVGGVGLYSAHVVNADMRALYEEELVPQRYISTIASRNRDVALAVDEALIAGDRRSKVNARATIRMHRDEILQAWESYKAVPKAPEEEQLANEMWERRNEIVRIDDQIFEAFAAGDMERARRVRTEQLEPAIHAFAESSDKLLLMLGEHADHITQHSNASYERNRTLVAGMILLAAFGGAFLAFLLARSIIGTLQTAVHVSSRIAEGQLGHDIEVKGHDELADLLNSLKTMDGKLNDVVADVRQSASAVGSAVDQLSRGNDDLSQRTQEQASALEETAASMEEMNATVKQNADNAQQAERIAREARKQAESGSEEVQRTIAAMQAINESSRKIADIISVIDEIAFQTNLLALNAAVEAARAGEQGRGFAVVATEVRNLAQRSATAAKETKELINESLNKVKIGSELVDGSGRTLTGIMDSVKKVSDIVSEIAAASSEQASGVDQVNHAVSQMDETTQQNAALVEEASAASKTLQQQAQQLIAAMSFFNQSHAAGAAPTAMRTAAVIPLPKSAAASTRRPASHKKRSVTPAPRPTAARASKASGDNVWNEF